MIFFIFFFFRVQAVFGTPSWLELGWLLEKWHFQTLFFPVRSLPTSTLRRIRLTICTFTIWTELHACCLWSILSPFCFIICTVACWRNKDLGLYIIEWNIELWSISFSHDCMNHCYTRTARYCKTYDKPQYVQVIKLYQLLPCRTADTTKSIAQ